MQAQLTARPEEALHLAATLVPGTSVSCPLRPFLGWSGHAACSRTAVEGLRVMCLFQVGACWCWTGHPQELYCMAPC